MSANYLRESKSLAEITGHAIGNHDNSLVVQSVHWMPAYTDSKEVNVKPLENHNIS